jgi:hypothetical protein
MIALLLAAQVITAPPAQVNTATLATKAEVQAAQDAAKAASDAAVTACQPSASVPPMETVGGAAGSGTGCRLANSIQPRISRTVTGVTTSAGTGTVTWPAMPSVPKLTVTPYVASGAVQAPMCFPVAGSVTTTGATVKCFTTQTVTVAVLGAVVAPIITAAAGVSFDVLALP